MADETKVTPPEESGAGAPRDETAPDNRAAPNPPAQPKTVEHLAPAAATNTAPRVVTPAASGAADRTAEAAAVEGDEGDAAAPPAEASATSTAPPKPAVPAASSAAPPKPAVASAGSAVPPKPAAATPGAAPARPAAPAKPAVPAANLAGKTTTVGAGAAAKPASSRAADDTSPLLSRRAWIGLAWGAFTAASAAALAATGRFMFPNVLNEPPAQFKAGFPAEYVPGVDERWKEKFGVWLVRTPNDIIHQASGFYALLTTCTHLGCTPNWLAAELKFKCPCHGSGFRPTGINFEGPAPRPLERARIVLAEDGQILIDKSRKYQWELGQWADPESFLQV